MRSFVLLAIFFLISPRTGMLDPKPAWGDEPESHFLVADFERFGVGVSTAGAGEVDQGVRLPGEIRPDADKLAHIGTRFPGVVRDVPVRVGDVVHAGTSLASIESDNLSTYVLRAPFEGTIIGKHITPGEVVGPSAPAFVLADLRTVWAEIRVYQDALAELTIGRKVLLREGLAGHEAVGTISFVSPVVDQATRTASARVVLANDDGLWRPGTFVEASVLSPRPADVVVSLGAIHNVEGRTVMFVVEDNRFNPRTVVVGATGATRAAILSGLQPGERYADSGSFLVKAELAKGEAGVED